MHVDNLHDTLEELMMSDLPPETINMILDDTNTSLQERIKIQTEIHNGNK